MEASVAIRSKMSLTNELRMAMALFEIPVSGWTCLRTTRNEKNARKMNKIKNHLCRCRMNKSPCESAYASSCLRQRQVPPSSRFWKELEMGKLQSQGRLNSLLSSFRALSRFSGCLAGSRGRRLLRGGDWLRGHSGVCVCEGVRAKTVVATNGCGWRTRLNRPPTNLYK